MNAPQQRNSGVRTYSGSRENFTAESRRSTNSGRISENITRPNSGNSNPYNRSIRSGSGTSSSSVRRQGTNNFQQGSSNFNRAASVRRPELINNQSGRNRSINQPISRGSALSKSSVNRSMPQSISSNSNNYRSRSVDMGRISRSSGPSRSMSASVRSSGSMSRGSSSVSHSRSSGGSRSSGSGSSGTRSRR